MMDNKILCGLAALSSFAFSAASASAQNLDPTVEVDRTYQGKLLEVDKPTLEMEVPDSLLRFDLDFSYDVLNNPYGGSYKFTPYRADMRPQADAYDGRRFFLRAGAGYQLRPELDLVYSPDFRGNRFQLNLYGNVRSFFGNYSKIGILPAADPSTDWKIDAGNGDRSGYDFLARAGADGRYNWRRGFLSFDLGYYGLGSKSWRSYYGKDFKNELNAVDFGLRVASNDERDKYFLYDVKAAVRVGSDKMATQLPSDPKLGFLDFSAMATLGPVVDSYSKILVDIYVGMSKYSDLYSGHIGNIYIAPHYFWDYNRWHFKVGVKVGSAVGSDSKDGALFRGPDSQIIYPDVKIGFEAVDGCMNLYALASGGDQVNNWSSLLADNHFLTSEDAVTLDNSIERFNTGIGMEGNWSAKFNYDLRLGVAAWKNGLVDMPEYYSSPDGTGILPGVGYEDYNEFYVAGRGAFHTERLDIDGSFRYRSQNLWSDRNFAIEAAPLSFGVSSTYNWNHKIYGGLSVKGATLRRGVVRVLSSAGGALSASSETCRVPGWINLGIHGEYAFTRKLHFFLDADNLLDSDIQYHPGLSAPGISVIGGIILIL